LRFDDQKFEINDKTGRVIANIVKHHDSFWIFHKNLIDDSLAHELLHKPEERLWLSVASNRLPQYKFATIKLQLGDVIKIGRVRFKVREIVSPIYTNEQAQHKIVTETFDVINMDLEPCDFNASQNQSSVTDLK
jgi:hypothetical protein